MPSRMSVLVGVAALAVALAACGSSTPVAAPSPASPALSTSSPPSATPTTTTAPATTPTTPTRKKTTDAPASAGATPSKTRTTQKTRPARLPLDLRTGDAEQVVTVVTSSGGDTTATVQRWSKDGSSWRKVGSAIDGYVGSDGVGTASESSSKTPKGSWTLTEAFGRQADPGTRLPYTKTTPDDYWISSPGPNYNTRQRCGDCGYDNDENERLYYVTPEYEHAVVIDYNTRNAPGGVEPGKGSAFFLHVSAGKPTAGCVAVGYDALDTIMRWLRPADHPRILIGVD